MLKLHCRCSSYSVSFLIKNCVCNVKSYRQSCFLGVLTNIVAFGMRSGGSSGGVGGMSRGSYTGGATGAKGSRNVSPYSAMSGLGNEYGYNSNVRKSKDTATPKSTGRNISTPQIVFILTLIMSLGFAGYYFIQFYPFLCSSEKKYDVMSRSSVTPTHSREFEYDESTSSATKSTNASYSNEHDV